MHSMSYLDMALGGRRCGLFGCVRESLGIRPRIREPKNKQTLVRPHACAKRCCRWSCGSRLPCFAVLMPIYTGVSGLVSCGAETEYISRRNLGLAHLKGNHPMREDLVAGPRSRTECPVCGKVPFLTVILSHCDTWSAATSRLQSGLDTRIHSINSRLQVQRTRADRMDRMFIAHVKALVPFFDCSLFPSQCNEPQEKRPNGHLTAGLVQHSHSHRIHKGSRSVEHRKSDFAW